jgi:PHD/YefM family antitoxin component YafN of YafNO toxin-antitoxin module
MPVTHLTGAEFDQDPARAKRAANQGPVIVTDRGMPAYVLMTHDAFRRLTSGNGASIIDLLAHAESGDIDFEPARLSGGFWPAEEPAPSRRLPKGGRPITG